ncbi:hypothetical protein [Streptomyces sp. NEAU-W12]|uniref:hypothetical protein n=1 Tax=Streptomyces sp. NEAU-W12 TaxID=2994668 RepID=UPI00224AA5BC|nr:hypothetical protein [Streptomyces sp. NEAU-W12]MCX2926281.1 hypothetical protein [Streptomyces sp. NEAU-W12]
MAGHTLGVRKPGMRAEAVVAARDAFLDVCREDFTFPVVFFVVLQEGRWPPGPA